MSYGGLILDFGGVVTTELSAFCVREGLAPDAFARALRDAEEGTAAFAAVETGAISQRDFEVTIGRLLGVSDHGLLKRALADDAVANLPAAEALGLATVHFTAPDAGIAEIRRLLGLS